MSTPAPAAATVKPDASSTSNFPRPQKRPPNTKPPPASATASTAPSSAKSAAAKAATSCAPTCPKPAPPTSGTSTSSWLLRSRSVGLRPACGSLSRRRPAARFTEIEAAFRTLKDDLDLRPIHHQLDTRIEAHMLMPSPHGFGTLRAAFGSLPPALPGLRLISFLAYCLHVTLRARLRQHAPGLTTRAVLDKFAAIQMLDVHFPTTDGRTLILRRYTQPGDDQKLLLQKLKLQLPDQPPPKITAPTQPPTP